MKEGSAEPAVQLGVLGQDALGHLTEVRGRLGDQIDDGSSRELFGAHAQGARLIVELRELLVGQIDRDSHGGIIALGYPSGRLARGYSFAWATSSVALVGPLAKVSVCHAM